MCTCVILAQTFPKEREADVVGYFGALCSHPRTVGLLTGSNQWKEDDGWLEFCASSSRLMLRVDPELHQALCTCWSVAQGASGPDGPWDLPTPLPPLLPRSPPGPRPRRPRRRRPPRWPPRRAAALAPARASPAP